MNQLHLNLRHQVLSQTGDGRNRWQIIEAPTVWGAQETALLLCDVWDRHHCRGAMIREQVMIPRMNQTVAAARGMGVLIVHAPSGTMGFYEDSPARKRALSTPLVDLPPSRAHPDPPLPIDSSDPSDTNHGDETPGARLWTRQHPDVHIDQDCDVISDDGHLVYSIMRSRGIRNLLIMGVHTNMCILNRSFAIKQMVKWGVDVALVRDLTDAMYNPAKPPYVSHEEGTHLVVEYIEKFWCPTILSQDLLDSARA